MWSLAKHIGETWQENGITPQRVRDLNGPIIRDASPALWAWMD
jgi:hypothetical protein